MQINWLPSLDLQRFFKGEAARPAPYVLKQRNVYILPTRQGLFFGITLLVILLGAVNYSNSLGYLLAFLLGSIAVMAILHTYRNLLGLQVRIGALPPVFQHQLLQVPVILDNQDYAARWNIQLTFPDEEAVQADVPEHQTVTINITRTASRRGYHALGRFTLSTCFPLGLLRAWSHVTIDTHYLVYPAPAPQADLPVSSLYIASLLGDQGVGSDDFAGLRNFRSGDSLKHVHWKALARQQGLLTKQFGGDRSEQLWLDWRMLEELPVEARLSQLCRWIIEADLQGFEYGLWLPSQEIAPARGTEHRHRCLRALALYE